MNPLLIMLLGLIFIVSGSLVIVEDHEQLHRIQYVNELIYHFEGLTNDGQYGEES